MNPLRLSLLIASLIALAPFVASAATGPDRFECLSGLMSITTASENQIRRNGVERPFMVDRFMVFPDVSDGKLTGFYIYSGNRGWHFDSIEEKISGRTRFEYIADLKLDKMASVFKLVAQPGGLETITLAYLPEFSRSTAINPGSVVLGASVLPLVGAFMGFQGSKGRNIYINPNDYSERELKEWILKRTPTAQADKVDDIYLNRRMVRMVSRHTLSPEALWRPFREELKGRQKWIKERNLDTAAFRQLTRLMETSCNGASTTPGHDD